MGFFPFLTVSMNYILMNYTSIFDSFLLLLLLCRVMQRKQSLGKPDQKDLNENLAATQGLAHMIAECKKLFQVRRWEGWLLCAGYHEWDKIIGFILAVS